MWAQIEDAKSQVDNLLLDFFFQDLFLIQNFLLFVMSWHFYGIACFRLFLTFFPLNVTGAS